MHLLELAEKYTNRLCELAVPGDSLYSLEEEKKERLKTKIRELKPKTGRLGQLRNYRDSNAKMYPWIDAKEKRRIAEGQTNEAQAELEEIRRAREEKETKLQDYRERRGKI